MPDSAASTPVRRCFVHVGLQKTGTSYLQSVFWQSAEALREQGLGLLPGTRAGAYHLMLAVRDQLREGIDPPKAFTVLRRLPRQAARLDTPHALISQESLAPASPDQVRRLVTALEPFEVHVVVTARDLARQIPSTWQQRMRTRRTEPYDAFVRAVAARGPHARVFWAQQDLPAVLDRWGSVVPAERVHLVTVPPAGTPGAVLLERFCAAVGVSPEGLDTRASRPNASLGSAQAELLRRVNVALGDRLPHPRRGYAAMVKRFLAGEILAAQPGDAVAVPRDLESWCIELAEAWTKDVTARGVDVVGDLADLVPPAEAFAGCSTPVADAAVAAAASEALAELVHRRRGEVHELDDLRARVTRLEGELAAYRAGGSPGS